MVLLAAAKLNIYYRVMMLMVSHLVELCSFGQEMLLKVLNVHNRPKVH